MCRIPCALTPKTKGPPVQRALLARERDSLGGARQGLREQLRDDRASDRRVLKLLRRLSRCLRRLLGNGANAVRYHQASELRVPHLLCRAPHLLSH